MTDFARCHSAIVEINLTTHMMRVTFGETLDDADETMKDGLTIYRRKSDGLIVGYEFPSDWSPDEGE